MKKFILVSSIISVCFVIIFFILEIIINKNNQIMPDTLQNIFGMVFLAISICVFVFLIFALLGKIRITAKIEVNLLEIFIAAVLMGVVSLFLIFHK